MEVLQSTGDRGLDAALTAAMKRWKYRPYLRDGKVIAFCHPLTVEYFHKPR
jgi:TonB family protein